MNKKWEYANPNEEIVKEISKKFGINELLASILVNRNVIEEETIKKFLNPTRNDFYNPFTLPDIEKAVDRIIKAMNNNERVIIYGDYDVDGITSTTVLKKFLDERGMNVGYYIPNRLDEGYGLNKDSVTKIVNDGYTLMITVDCGISGIEEVNLGNSLGLETIITDHHEPLEELPNAIAVVDAKRKDNQYPCNQLAGVGVVFKLIQAISIKLGLDEKEYLKYLDLVCVGTISDIVPLIDENRIIAKLGLKLVEVTKNLGLKILLKSIGYTNIDSNTVSFGIAPRINACGRMGHEIDALNLFLTENIKEAEELTDRLNQYNTERQNTEKEIVKQALEKIQKEDLNKMSVIVLGDERWHHGVIGIVSSKLTEQYFKPSVLICYEGDEGRGSGRSIPGFDLHNALCKSSKYLEKYGGHAMAVGLSLNKQNFEDFKKELDRLAKEANVDEIIPIIKVDKLISLKNISIQMVKELNLLEPFGEANKKPLFACKNLKIDSIRALTEGKHLKLTLRDENYVIDAIGFNLGYMAEDYTIGDKVDVVGMLEINEFNGKEKIQLNLKDLMKSL